MDTITKNRIESFSLFNGLKAFQLEEIAALVTLKNYTEGSNIVREGDVGGELYLLLEGEIIISKRLTLYSLEGEDQRDKSLIRLQDKDNVFFGEMSLFDDAERSATVTAVSHVTCGILTRHHIESLCSHDADVGYHIFHNIGRTLAFNLRRANRDILKLTTAFCLALEKA